YTVTEAYAETASCTPESRAASTASAMRRARAADDSPTRPPNSITSARSPSGKKPMRPTRGRDGGSVMLAPSSAAAVPLPARHAFCARALSVGDAAIDGAAAGRAPGGLRSHPREAAGNDADLARSALHGFGGQLLLGGAAREQGAEHDRSREQC